MHAEDTFTYLMIEWILGVEVEYAFQNGSTFKHLESS